jgi:hypothetical protein
VTRRNEEKELRPRLHHAVTLHGKERKAPTFHGSSRQAKAKAPSRERRAWEGEQSIPLFGSMEGPSTSL